MANDCERANRCQVCGAEMLPWCKPRHDGRERRFCSRDGCAYSEERNPQLTAADFATLAPIRNLQFWRN